MGRTRHTCNNCAIEPCAIRNALVAGSVGGAIATHGITCKFHVYKPKIEVEPVVQDGAQAQSEQVVENAGLEDVVNGDRKAEEHNGNGDPLP